MAKNTPQRKSTRSFKSPEFGSKPVMGLMSQTMLETELYALTIGEPSPKDKVHYAEWSRVWESRLHEYQKRFPNSSWLKRFQQWAETPRH